MTIRGPIRELSLNESRLKNAVSIIPHVAVPRVRTLLCGPPHKEAGNMSNRPSKSQTANTSNIPGMPFQDLGLATVGETCAVLKIGKTTANKLMRLGVLEKRKLGACTRITRASIARVVAGA